MSRNDAQSRRLRRRPNRTVPATIVALVLLAVGVLALVAAIYRLAQGGWPTQVSSPAGSVAGATWGSAPVLVSGVVVLLVGVVLLVAGIKLGAFHAAQLATPEGGAVEETDYVISSRSLARLSAARADTVDGVDKVSASASGNRVRVKVTTTSEKTDDITHRVQQRVSDTLAAIGVQPAARVSVTVHTKGI